MRAEENGGRGLAVGKSVVPDIKMSIPEGVHFNDSGEMRYYDHLGKSRNLTNEILKEPKYHDWMKSYAENLKRTMPDGRVLIKGAKELIDAPTFAEGNASLTKYLEAKHPGKYPNATLASIMPDEKGIINFKFGVDGSSPGKVMRSSIDENLAPKGLQIGSPTSISTRSNRLPAVALDLDKTIFKATPEMQAAEDKALKFLKMNPEANLSLRAEAWGDWEKLAVGNLEANKEMLGFVKQLQDSGISMNVMTARSARVQEQTLGLLGKMDFIPDEVFFRPYTLEGEMEAAEKMKVGWIKKTSDKFDYISIFDDSQKTVTAALKSGVPSALQPSAGAIDRKFLQGSLERGLETMQATFSQDPNQLTRGISELENLIDMGAKKNTSRMLGAASEASAAVAGGIQKSGILRNAAAAATILGKRI